MLPSIVNKFDSGSAYIPSSPMIGWGHKESLEQGDSHYWGVWWGKEPFSVFENKIGRFMSEYGFQGFPDRRTVQAFTRKEDRFLGSSVMKAHQKHPEGFDIIDQYMDSDFIRPKIFDLYNYTSQLLQAGGIKVAIEAHRRAKPYCMGTLFWQYNDCWPVISWSARDYYGRWKALMYTVKDAYKTMLVSPLVEGEKLNVYVVSDSSAEVSAELQMRLMDFSGKTIWEKVVHAQVPADVSQSFFSEDLANLPAFKKESSLLEVALKSAGRTLAGNVLYFVAPKDLKLSKPRFKINVTQGNEAYTIEISAEKLLKNVSLGIDEDGRFTCNYMDILPGENRKVVFKTSSKINNFEKKLKITSLYDAMK